MEEITAGAMAKLGTTSGASTQDAERLFVRALAELGPAISRIARANEADPERRADLQQEIYFALWRSLPGFDGRCSLGTWVYRIALNMAARHIAQQRRVALRELQNLESIADPIDPHDADGALDDERRLTALYALIGRLKPLDRQVVLLYLDDLDAAQISEVIGLSPSHVAVKVHRIKQLLAHMYAGARHDQP